MIKRIFLIGLAVLVCHKLARADEDGFVEVPLLSDVGCQTDDPRDEIDVAALANYCAISAELQKNFDQQLKLADEENFALKQQIERCREQFLKVEQIINAQQKKIFILSKSNKSLFDLCCKVRIMNYWLMWHVVAKANAPRIKAQLDALVEFKARSNRAKHLKTVAGLMAGVCGLLWVFYRYKIAPKEELARMVKMLLNSFRQKIL